LRGLRYVGVMLVALILVVLGAASCGSAERLPAAEYFPRVESELARLNDATRDLTSRFGAELESELAGLLAELDLAAPGAADRARSDITAVARSKMQAIIVSHGRQLEIFVDRVGELVPPVTVASAHEELVESFSVWAGTAQATVERLAAAEALEDLTSALAGSPFADAQLRVDVACRELTDNAASVGVVLTCPGTRLDVLEVTP